MNFDEAFSKLIGHEGVYSNHPSDPGLETMYGITLNVARANGYFGRMQDLDLATAKKIARAQYWDKVKADQLPEEVRFDVFDGAYNSGVGQASKWLQRAVGVADDGFIGPATLAAAMVTKGIKAKYNGHRLAFMADLKTWETFGRGWARRIANNLKETA